MRTVRVFCTKNEDNKVYFVGAIGLDIMMDALQKYGEDRDVIHETCLALKAVTAVDDLRKDFSSAHNHTRQLVSKVSQSLTPWVLSQSKPDECIYVMSVYLSIYTHIGGDSSLDQIRQIIPRGFRPSSRSPISFKEFGHQWWKCGADRFPRWTGYHDEGARYTSWQCGKWVQSSENEYYGSTYCDGFLSLPMFEYEQVMARTAISVFRNVSADDKYKTVLCNNGGAELMIKASAYLPPIHYHHLTSPIYHPPFLMHVCIYTYIGDEEASWWCKVTRA